MTRPNWRDLVSASIVVAVIFGVTTVVITQGVSIKAFQDADVRQQNFIDQQQDAIDQLRRQVLELGERPVVSAPEPPAASTAGANGSDGRAGRDGINGQDGEDGTTGLPGIPGQTGANGTDGATGEPGPAGPTGAAGADGAPGATGAAGEPGAAGQPPYSWIYTDLLGQHSCVRDDPFDPAAPTYSCS